MSSYNSNNESNNDSNNSKYGLYVGGEHPKQYVAKYNPNTNSFESILSGLKQERGRILAMTPLLPCRPAILSPSVIFLV